MLRLLLALLMGAASGACGFAAVGLALYAPGPHALWAAACFAAYGAAVGLGCGGLQLLVQGQPSAAPAALAPDALASLVRATLASTAAERQPRTGSVADRRPAVAPPAAATQREPAMAEAAAP